ncbi:MAG: VWA domain-containing protein [Pyrinomonadaceae bacterium]|nr:VWA domain-containing protein [Pyrinomonadaceae bacterium]
MNKQFLISALTIQLVLVQMVLPGSAQTLPAPQQRPTASQSVPQQPARQDDDDVVKITTNLVQVDAVVTEKNGRPVTDLRPEEVEIREDGKPQKITNLSYVVLDSIANPARTEPAKPIDKTAPVPPVRLRPEEVRRTMALVVDDLGLSFESAHFVRQALKKFLDQQMQPNDLVAIIRTGGGMGALQQFTSDKRQLYAAVEKVKWNPTGRGGIGAFAPLGGSASSPSQTESANADLDQFREDIFAVGTLGAVHYIVRGLRELPGRKSVVLISDGLRIFNRSDPGGSGRILAALRNLTDLANRASVVIYTLDARGLQALSLTAADSTAEMTTAQIEQSLSDRRTDFFESQNGLNYLAQQTGGLAIRNSNDLAGGIRRVVDDQKGYYLIAYRPDESTFDRVNGRRKFHKLALKVTRPGKFNIRMRNGFFGVTDEQSASATQTPAQQLFTALTSPFGATGVQVRLTSLFANDLKIGSFMRSMLHVRGRDLTFTDEPDGWHKAVFDIVAVTFGDNGVVVDQLNRTHTIRVKGKTYERILSSGFTYNLTVPIKKAGAYQLRTALRDLPSSRLGSANQFIEVPDLKKNRLTISGILATGMRADAYKKSLSAPTQAANPDEIIEELDSNAGAALRMFKTGSVLVYGFVIYNAQVDKISRRPQLQTQLRLFRNGQQVFTGREIAFDAANQVDLKRLEATGAIMLGSDLGPGEYQLQVIVTDPLGKEKYRVATQWIDFEVVK